MEKVRSIFSGLLGLTFLAFAILGVYWLVQSSQSQTALKDSMKLWSQAHPVEGPQLFPSVDDVGFDAASKLQDSGIFSPESPIIGDLKDLLARIQPEGKHLTQWRMQDLTHNQKSILRDSQPRNNYRNTLIDLEGLRGNDHWVALRPFARSITYPKLDHLESLPVLAELLVVHARYAAAAEDSTAVYRSVAGVLHLSDLIRQEPLPQSQQLASELMNLAASVMEEHALTVLPSDRDNWRVALRKPLWSNDQVWKAVYEAATVAVIELMAKDVTEVVAYAGLTLGEVQQLAPMVWKPQWNRQVADLVSARTDYDRFIERDQLDALRQDENAANITLRAALDDRIAGVPSLLTADTARRRVTEVGLALIDYYERHRSWPTQLERLSPSFLETVPNDPFTGEPLRYRAEKGYFLLYSIGPDKKDDGGLPLRQEDAAVGTTGDVVWLGFGAPPSLLAELGIPVQLPPEPQAAEGGAETKPD